MTDPLPVVRSDPVAEVLKWIVAGASQDEINEAIAQHWPAEKPRPLIVAAMKRVAAAAEVDRDTLVGWCIEATRTVYQRALEANDFGAALRAIKQLHAFAGNADV